MSGDARADLTDAQQARPLAVAGRSDAVRALADRVRRFPDREPGLRCPEGGSGFAGSFA
jgi:hypothetical protein